MLCLTLAGRTASFELSVGSHHDDPLSSRQSHLGPRIAVRVHPWGIMPGAFHVAVEPQAPPSPESSVALSPIENEIPTYRAISGLAITSLLLGLFAIGTFASKAFVISGVAAVITGVIAERRIRRSPDALTGRAFAQLGIALGLIFTLSSLTFGFMRDWRVRGEAMSFARSYEEILQSGSLADAFWYRSRPSMRTGKTPPKMLAEFEKAASEGGDPAMRAEQLGGIERLIQDINHPGTSIRFLRLETYGFNEVTPYAFLVYEIQHSEHEDEGDASEAAHHHGSEIEYVLVHIQSDPSNPTFDWHIERVVFPYSLSSMDLEPKPLDDGHGHSH